MYRYASPTHGTSIQHNVHCSTRHARAASGAGPNYLEEDIVRRVAVSPVKFTLQVQLAAKGDQIYNPSITWPDSRDTVTLGVITITHVAENSEKVEVGHAASGFDAGMEVYGVTNSQFTGGYAQYAVVKAAMWKAFAPTVSIQL
jgi:hypothetical protein